MASISISRRDALKAGAAVAPFLIVSSSAARTYKANEKVRLGVIACGGRGRDGISAGLREHLVAMCDVDPTAGRGTAEQIARAREGFPDAKLFTDLRQLFDAKLDLDAVWVATPDHTHFPAAYRAIDAGLAVFCEKPLTWSAYEARTLAHAAAEKKVVTQMGNQGHASEDIRLLCEYVWQGSLGAVSEVHVRSKGSQSAGKIEQGQQPAKLNWDAWLGPAADRPYIKNVHPFKWRGWVDFGTGQLGDWFCHNADGAVWALKLDQADTVEVESDTPPLKHGFNPNGHFIWHFPARADMPPVKLVWRHGGNSDFTPDADVPQEFLRGSAIYIGDKGMAISGNWMKGVQLVPESFQQQVGRPKQVIPRVKGIADDFFHCIRNGGQPCSNFVYAGRLTEIMHVGNIAARVGEKLSYDFRKGKFVNSPQADALMTRQPRKGWEFGYA